MEKGAALNVFFREQNGRLEDTSDRSYGDELYCRERPETDIPRIPAYFRDAVFRDIHILQSDFDCRPVPGLYINENGDRCSIIRLHGKVPNHKGAKLPQSGIP